VTIFAVTIEMKLTVHRKQSCMHE